jgi:hypothetical protein
MIWRLCGKIKDKYQKKRKWKKNYNRIQQWKRYNITILDLLPNRR